MPDTDFNIPDFLRLIGKGPEERPEWWRENYFIRDGCIPMCPREFICAPPFADILDHWTPEKDALLLGVGLEYIRSYNAIGKNSYFIFQRLAKDCDMGSGSFAALHLLGVCDRPGERLARAIWDAVR